MGDVVVIPGVANATPCSISTFSVHGHDLVAFASRHVVYVYTRAGDAVQSFSPGPASVRCIATHPSSGRIAVVDDEFVCCVYELHRNQLLWDMSARLATADTCKAQSVTLHPTQPNTMLLCGQTIQEMQFKKEWTTVWESSRVINDIVDCAFNMTGSHFFVRGDVERFVKVYDMKTKRFVYLPHPSPVGRCEFHACGALMSLCPSEGITRIWMDGSLVGTVDGFAIWIHSPPDLDIRNPQNESEVWCMSLEDDGSVVVHSIVGLLETRRRTARVSQFCAKVRSQGLLDDFTYAHACFSESYEPQTISIVAADPQYSLRMQEFLPKRKEYGVMRGITGHVERVTEIVRHPNRMRITSVDEEGVAIVWDYSESFLRSVGRADRVFKVAWVPDTSYLLVVRRDSVSLVDTETMTAASEIKDRFADVLSVHVLNDKLFLLVEPQRLWAIKINGRDLQFAAKRTFVAESVTASFARIGAKTVNVVAGGNILVFSIPGLLKTPAGFQDSEIAPTTTIDFGFSAMEKPAVISSATVSTDESRVVFADTEAGNVFITYWVIPSPFLEVTLAIPKLTSATVTAYNCVVTSSTTEVKVFKMVEGVWSPVFFSRNDGISTATLTRFGLLMYARSDSLFCMSGAFDEIFVPTILPMHHPLVLKDLLTRNELTRVTEILDSLKGSRETNSVIQAIQNKPENLDTFAMQVYLSFKSRRNLTLSDICYALHSDTQSSLLTTILPEKYTIKELIELRVPLWLKDPAVLKQHVETVAKLQYLINRDPNDCALLYLALKKRTTLVGLFKVGKNERFQKFFGQDFDNDEKARIAALKNGYNLLSKRQFELAAAFFLLGNSLKDCVGVLNKNGFDMLALLVVRTYMSSIDNEFAKPVIDNYVEMPDRWANYIGLWLNKDYETAVDRLSATPRGGESVEWPGVLNFLEMTKKPVTDELREQCIAYWRALGCNALVEDYGGSVSQQPHDDIRPLVALASQKVLSPTQRPASSSRAAAPRTKFTFAAKGEELANLHKDLVWSFVRNPQCPVHYAVALRSSVREFSGRVTSDEMPTFVEVPSKSQVSHPSFVPFLSLPIPTMPPLSDISRHDDPHNLAAHILSTHPFLPFYLSGNADGTVSLFQFGHAERVKVFSCASGVPIASIAFSSEGNRFCVADSDGGLSLFRWADEVPIMKISCHQTRGVDSVFLGNASEVATVGISGNSKELAIWDTLYGAQYSLQYVHEFDDLEPRSLLYIPALGRLVVGGKKGEIAIFQLSDRTVLKVWSPHTGSVRSLSLQPGEQRVFASGCSDGDIKVWDCESLEEVASIAGAHARHTFIGLQGKSVMRSFGVMQVHLTDQGIESCGGDGRIVRRPYAS